MSRWGTGLWQIQEVGVDRLLKANGSLKDELADHQIAFILAARLDKAVLCSPITFTGNNLVLNACQARLIYFSRTFIRKKTIMTF